MMHEWKHGDDDDDNDSATTLGGGSVDLLALPSPPKKHTSTPTTVVQKEQAPPSSGGSSTILSPATRTLDALSQHSAIGGGSLRYDMSQLEGDPVPTAAASAVLDQESQGVAVDESGTSSPKSRRNVPTTHQTASKQVVLPPKKRFVAPQESSASSLDGQVASKVNSNTVVATHNGRTDPPTNQATPPNLLMGPQRKTSSSVFNPKDFAILNVTLTEPGPFGMVLHDGEPKPSNCVVKRVVEGGQAEAAGVRAGDVVLYYNSKKMAPFDEVVSWSSGPRPIKFSIIRPASSPAANDSVESDKNTASLPRNEAVPNGQPGKSPPAEKPQPKETARQSPKCPSDGILQTKRTSSNKLPADDSPQRKQASQRQSPLEHPASSPGTSKSQPLVLDEDSTTTEAYTFNGKEYDIYLDMVKAKRQHNHDVMVKSGLLAASNDLREAGEQAAAGTQRGQDKKNNKTSERTPLPSRKSNRLPDAEIVEKDRNDVKDLVVPFCQACQKQGTTKSSGFHHPLCPKHPQFDNSGAEEKLEMIQRGVQIGCKACKWEYQHGRKNGSRVHADQCERSRPKTRKHKETQSPSNTARSSVQKQSSQKRKVGTNTTAKHTHRKEAPKKKARGSREEAQSQSKDKASASGKLQITEMCLSDVDDDDCEISEGALSTKRKPSRGLSTVTPNEATRSHKDPPKGSAKKRKVGVTPSPQLPITTGDLDETLESGIESSQAAIKPKWEPCPNPWGPMGHLEGDVVLFSPSGGFTHHESLFSSKRFAMDPFAAQSTYLDSHARPQDGYHLLQLSRDSMALRPWGFTFRYHDFGGACLVQSVEPLSPAEAAVHVGHPDTTPDGGSSGLRVNDMLVCINGKVVGGMTEMGLSMELDVCGPELLLVVSRYKHVASSSQHAAEEERKTWSVVDQAPKTGRLQDWNEIGATGETVGTELQLFQAPHRGSEERKRARGTTGEVAALHEQEAEPIAVEGTQQKVDQSSGEKNFEAKHFSNEATSHVPLKDDATRTPSGSRTKVTDSIDVQSPNQATSDGDDEHSSDDSDPWLGCVCGKIHRRPVKVFWIQCEVCEAWYNVSDRCIGFGEEEAKSLQSWHCLACSDASTIHSSGSVNNDNTSTGSNTDEETSQRLRHQPEELHNKTDKTVISKRIEWKEYPELNALLDAKWEEYFRLRGSDQRIQYIRQVTEHLLELATKHGYVIDPEVLSFKDVQDRIRYRFYYLNNLRKQGSSSDNASCETRLLAGGDPDNSSVHSIGSANTGSAGGDACAEDQVAQRFQPQSGRRNPPVKTTFTGKIPWKNYPELDTFMHTHRGEYFHQIGESTQKQYIDRLTERFLKWTTERGYAFDEKVFSFLDVRNRIVWRMHTLQKQVRNSDSNCDMESLTDDSPLQRTKQQGSNNGSKVLETGTVVNVAQRTGPGSNKPGGIGKVVASRVTQNGEIVYDIQYVLGGRESDVDAEWVTPHTFDFSPSASVTSTRGSRPPVDTRNVHNLKSSSKKKAGCLPLGSRTGASAKDNNGKKLDCAALLYPKKPAVRNETGAYTRPKGRAPNGREWDAKLGAWRRSDARERG